MLVHRWSFDDYVEDYLLFVEHTRANLEPRPCFLLGRGMGATIAIQVMRAFVEIEEERKREAQSLTSTPDQPARGLRAPAGPSSSHPSLASPTSYSASPFQGPNSPRVEVDDSDARAALWHWHGCVLISPAIIPPATVSPLAEMLAHLCYDFFPKVLPALPSPCLSHPPPSCCPPPHSHPPYLTAQLPPPFPPPPLSVCVSSVSSPSRTTVGCLASPLSSLSTAPILW